MIRDDRDSETKPDKLVPPRMTPAHGSRFAWVTAATVMTIGSSPVSLAAAATVSNHMGVPLGLVGTVTTLAATGIGSVGFVCKSRAFHAANTYKQGTVRNAYFQLGSLLTLIGMATGAIRVATAEDNMPLLPTTSTLSTPSTLSTLPTQVRQPSPQLR